MSPTPTRGQYADALEAAQLQAIHELRGEPPDDGWQAAGLLASAHIVSRVAPSPTGGLWQPTHDETLCFFVDELELGGSVSVAFARDWLAQSNAQTLTRALKNAARAMLALHQTRG